MDGNYKTAIFKAAPYIMKQHQAGVIKTVMGKARFKQWLWDQCVSEVKHYQCDNGIISAEEYRLVKRKEKVNLSQGLAPNTKMQC